MRTRLSSHVNRAVADRRLPDALGAVRAIAPVRTIYDIGARHGSWARQLAKHYPADFILFEANDEHASELAKRGFRFFTGILADEEREVEWVGKGGTGDSYYRENTDNYDVVSVRRVRATTLDKVVADNALPPPDLIKLDTQGSELDILDGGKQTLAHASFVYIECSLVNYNEGAPKLCDVLAYMERAGFLPCDIGEEHRKAHALIQLDVLFIRRALYDKLGEGDGLHY